MQDFPDISAVAKLYAAQGKRLLHPRRLGIVLEAAVRFFQILHTPAKTVGLTPQEIRLVLMVVNQLVDAAYPPELDNELEKGGDARA